MVCAAPFLTVILLLRRIGGNDNTILYGKIFPFLFHSLAEVNVEGDGGILQTLIGLRCQWIPPQVNIFQGIGGDHLIILDFWNWNRKNQRNVSLAWSFHRDKKRFLALTNDSIIISLQMSQRRHFEHHWWKIQE